MKREQRKAPRPTKEVKAAPRGAPVLRHAPVLGVVLLALLAYSNSFRAPFLLDSADLVLHDARVHADTPVNRDRILSSPYSESSLSGLYRPLTTYSFLFNYAVMGGGESPAMYHWLNFWLHAVNIVLVYALALALFEDRAAALAASALWALHPVLTEPVTNIAGRADLLAAFGVLASLLCYHAAARSTGLRRALWTAAVAAAVAVAVFSKESGVIAIGALLLFDVFFMRSEPARPRIAGLIAAAVPTAAFLAARALVVGRFPIVPIPFVDNPMVSANFAAARITAFKVIGKYAGLLLWPAKLSADYSYNQIPVAADASGLVALVLCVAAAGAAIWAWRGHKPLSFAIALFFVALAPSSNVLFLVHAIMAERYLYLPAVAFALAIVYLLRLLVERVPRSRAAVGVALAVIVLAFAGRSYARNRDWLDPRAFWQSVVDAAPAGYRGHIGLAGSLPLQKRADRDRAVHEITTALAILAPLPDDRSAPEAYRIAGAVYREMGDQVALHRADPDGSQPIDWYKRALPPLFRSQGMETARDAAYRALNEKRGTPRLTFLPSSIFFEIGRTYLREANQLEALSYYERGRSLEPNADLLEDEAATLESFGDYRKAAQVYVEALEIDGRRSYLNEKIVELYSKADPGGCAVKNGALNVSCPLVHGDICSAAKNVEDTFQRRGQSDDAAAIRRIAIIDLGCTGVGGK